MKEGFSMAKYADYGIAGKVAIVTGAGTGIGRSCAEELAKAGAQVALFGRRMEKLEETARLCSANWNGCPERSGPESLPGVLAVSVDVSDPAQVENGVEQVIRTFGQVDILINDAGIESRLKPGESFFGTLFEKLTPEEYLRFFEIHTLGHYLMCNAVIPGMRERHFGRIVNITSVNSNKHSDFGGLTRPLDQVENAYMHRSIEDIYDRFLNIVSEGRSMSTESVDEIAQGRVWCGTDALNIGLVDEIGTLEDAVNWVASEAGDPDLANWNISGYPKPQTSQEMLMEMFKSSSSANVFKGTVLENTAEVLLGLSKQKDIQILARMPYDVIVR